MSTVQFTRSRDQALRATFRVEHRLSLSDMADVLTFRHHKESDGVTVRELTKEIVDKVKAMSKETITKQIRWELDLYGLDEMKNIVDEERLNGISIKVQQLLRQRFQRELNA